MSEDNKKNKQLIIILGLLNGLMPFSTDLYLPAFPEMARVLGTDIGQITLSMSTFFAGSCLGQLINGPLLDKFGRKKPMLLGLSLFLLTSLGCAVASNVSFLIVLRFFQAIGISICTVGSRAIVRDNFPVEKTASIFSSMALVMGVSPIIAPSVGALVLQFYSWRAIFIMLAIMSGSLIIALSFFLSDNYIPEKQYSLRPKSILNTYTSVLKTPTFWSYSFVAALASGGLFTWISSSSFVFIKLLGLTESQFGWLFATTGSCLLISNQSNRYFLKHFPSSQIAIVAAFTQLFICALLVFISIHFFSVPFMLFGISCYMLSLHLITPNTMALAIRPFSENIGSAAALMGSIQMGLSTIVTVILSNFQQASALPMVITLSVIALISSSTLYRLKQKNYA
ncbi:Bcr/CflA family efflux MFS transporter [Flavobacterium sufflavum]|uniref:Bcr/CflA family efflux MFS transporter n=1 Tax=Flavobacterium sufflavum TaxID=1921138 RepID=A0A3S2XAY4_9FLAO|nr:multidrug effflux MFS transporter [Flavobacterium sufflavum]RVT73893.1 Bcr/CflA family efflux MFS transporter [Flavobacterium sufflavum]